MITKWKKTTILSIIGTQLIGCSLAPRPFDPQQKVVNLERDINALNLVRPPLPKQLSLNHAIARALKYNLDYRIKLTEQAMAQTDMRIANLNMLPNLVAHAGYVDRNNINEVLSPITGQVSTAEDRVRRLADLNFSWNILDFGVSYFESKQKADLVLIAEQQKRKMIQRISKDTRKAFWRAYSASHYFAKANGFDRKLKVAINNSLKAEKEKLMPPVDAARYRRDLWLLYNQIINLNFELARFKPELLSLISAPSHTPTVLTIHPAEQISITRQLPGQLDKLEQLALFYRPELQEENYRKRISLNEVRKARVRLLPGLEVNYGSYYDSNSFLVNNSWNQLSLSLSWNIIKILANTKKLRMAGQEAFLTEIRRVALSMAIITQVDIAKLSYAYAKENLYTNEQVLKNEQAIYDTLLKQQGNFESQFSLVKAQGALILAQLRRDLAYADYQTAAAELLNSLGLDPVYHTESIALSVGELTKLITHVDAHPIFKEQNIEKVLQGVTPIK